MAYYTLKNFIESAENYLIMINSFMCKKYISQIDEKYAIKTIDANNSKKKRFKSLFWDVGT